MGEEVKLLRTWSSPFGLRIVWALKLKGIEYETIYEDLSNKSPLLLQYNPVYKKIPVLVHKGKPISESLVILEYIEETWNQNPLLPADPYGRAMARFWARFSDDKLFPAFVDVISTQGKRQEEAISLVKENLKHIEKNLKRKFFGGDQIGFIDIALGWIANLFCVVEKVTGRKLIDAGEFPALSAWIQNFSEAPIIKENWPPHEKMVVKFQAIRERKLEAAAPK
ncbi:Glutathione transferase [Bertholletia excelsa]